MNEKVYCKLRKWLLPILYLLLAYAIFQLLTTSLSMYKIIQMKSEVESAIERDAIPMIMGIWTDNLLIYAGVSVKIARLISSFFDFLRAMSYVILVAMAIHLLRNTIKVGTPFSSINLARIKIAVMLYIGLPLVQCLFNCIIIIGRISSDYLVQYLISTAFEFAYILFKGILILFVVASFQHGIDLQQEADETL